MSFLAIIDSQEHKQFWSRAILSLSAISEQIKFVISSENLSLSSVNNAKTSHGEINFSRQFFRSFQMNFDGIMAEGYEDGESRSYSFIINSKSLSLLFKKIEDDLDYLMLKINCHKECPVKHQYKFLVEIKTKNLILKKLSTYYQPCLRNTLTLAAIYKEQLSSRIDKRQAENNFTQTTNEETEDGDNLNYLKIERLLLKNFLDMIPANTEDFSIEVRTPKISFTGFTRQIMKEKEYLKQPMSLSITIELEELLSKSLVVGDNEKLRVNFRLKDFKTFMNLISYCKSTDDEDFEVYFTKPGEPILFERTMVDETIIQFVQITEGYARDDVLPVTHTISHVEIPKLRGESSSVVVQKSVIESLFVPEVSQSRESTANRTKIGLNSVLANKATNDRGLGSDSFPIQESVIWNNVVQPPSFKRTRIGEDLGIVNIGDRSKLARLDDLGIVNIGDKSKLARFNNEDEEFGPTQNVQKPKGLFD